MNPLQIELYNKYLTHKIKYNQVQFSVFHSHMISEGLFVNMSENEACNRSGNMIEYAMLKDIKLGEVNKVSGFIENIRNKKWRIF